MAYAGTNREDLLETLMPIVTDPNLSCETCAFAALSLGMIFIG
jgi:26S proteasome regulatory subunit N1